MKQKTEHEFYVQKISISVYRIKSIQTSLVSLWDNESPLISHCASFLLKLHCIYVSLQLFFNPILGHEGGSSAFTYPIVFWSFSPSFKLGSLLITHTRSKWFYITLWLSVKISIVHGKINAVLLNFSHNCFFTPKENSYKIPQSK